MLDPGLRKWRQAMQYRKIEQIYVLRLEIGEEIITQLKNFCKELEIGSGKVSGIGVVRRATISYFDLPSGDYLHRDLSGNMEMTSLMGNISIMDGEPFPHLHVTLADKDFQLVAGHLSAGEIGVTGELVVEPFAETIERKINQESGLNLLVLDA
jgi:predicted DNA-binding protein with PD1-like motif